MNCQKCESYLAYGAKYCNCCGEKVPKGAYEEEYKDTIWSKIDGIKDDYDSFFLKKITDSLAFKIISMAVVLGYLFFTLYGNFMGIRLEANEDYTIEYNKQAEEYYIKPQQQRAQLQLYVPVGTEKLVFTEAVAEEKNVKEYTLEQYSQEGYSVSAGEHEHILIDAVRKEKVIDTIKIIVVSE